MVASLASTEDILTARGVTSPHMVPRVLDMGVRLFFIKITSSRKTMFLLFVSRFLADYSNSEFVYKAR